MALKREIARLSKILVEKEGISFQEAERRLSQLTLDIVIGDAATSAAAHAAILTAVNIGSRSFVGGVRVSGATGQPLNSALPLKGRTLREAAAEIGASDFEGPPRQTLVVAAPVEGIAIWWDGWRAGASSVTLSESGAADNPLSGIAAAGLGVGMAFLHECNLPCESELEVDLWAADYRPTFDEVFLPGALWLVGLGNLGQAYLWALTALPYEKPKNVELVLQDRDRISEENWGTSVLVFRETYGELKTKVGAQWAEARGFTVRRIDRKLAEADRLEDGDPKVAVSGLDRFAARSSMENVGFDCVVDAGLGRKAEDFDKLRVTVFDEAYPLSRYFAGQADAEAPDRAPDSEAYRELEGELGRCGAAEIAGASAAVPFVSALASAMVVARLIALASMQPYVISEVGRISRFGERQKSPCAVSKARGIKHAGRAKLW